MSMSSNGRRIIFPVEHIKGLEGLVGGGSTAGDKEGGGAVDGR